MNININKIIDDLERKIRSFEEELDDMDNHECVSMGNGHCVFCGEPCSGHKD